MCLPGKRRVNYFTRRKKKQKTEHGTARSELCANTENKYTGGFCVCAHNSAHFDRRVCLLYLRIIRRRRCVCVSVRAGCRARVILVCDCGALTAGCLSFISSLPWRRASPEAAAAAAVTRRSVAREAHCCCHSAATVDATSLPWRGKGMEEKIGNQYAIVSRRHGVSLTVFIYRLDGGGITHTSPVTDVQIVVAHLWRKLQKNHYF